MTLAQTINLTRAKTGASVLAKRFDCKTVVCDVGVNADDNCPEVLDYKLAYDTQNIAKGPAMTRELAERVIEIGRKLVYESDAEVIGIGEMGIGNTTTSSAILSVLTNSPVKSVTGRGGGISDEGYIKKIATIERAIELNNPDPNDAVDAVDMFKSHRAEWADSILICQDIFCGVVPIDKDMRAWRELTGRLCGYLSGEAESVTRMFCHIATKIK